MVLETFAFGNAVTVGNRELLILDGWKRNDHDFAGAIIPESIRKNLAGPMGDKRGSAVCSRHRSGG
tara:strand:- start:133 stop:330 length:198 start_codon:yes stop_codon:yes gene_type:complete